MAALCEAMSSSERRLSADLTDARVDALRSASASAEEDMARAGAHRRGEEEGTRRADARREVDTAAPRANLAARSMRRGEVARLTVACAARHERPGARAKRFGETGADIARRGTSLVSLARGAYPNYIVRLPGM